MQFFLAVLSAIALAYTATVPVAPWSTLTPPATFSGATTDHTHSFGIQIQTITSSPSTTAAKKNVVIQIGDGQIQKHTEETFAIPHPKTTDAVVNQIGDGQIQHQTTSTTDTIANQISDGQIQATCSAEYNEGTKGFPFACSAENALSMTLKDSLLTDSKGRVGAIVANRQFQFDGPPPQAGSIYAAGWSVTADGYLTIGDKDVFYQCKSGEFYNLYDENIAAQCEPVRLEVIDFVSC